MNKAFAATVVTHTMISRDARHLQISLANVYGQTQTVILTLEISAALSLVLQDFSRTATKHPSPLTKMPRGFAVGSGVHENLVLVRFENDVPYGLDPSVAAELGQALLDQSQVIDRRAAIQLQ